MLKLLNDTERLALSAIFEKEFDSDVPDARNANIVAVEMGGEVVGFLTSEVLIRVGQVWTADKLTKTESAKIMKQMTRYVIQSIPKGASVICIASESRFESFFRKLGMREMVGKVFRIDF